MEELQDIQDKLTALQSVNTEAHTGVVIDQLIEQIKRIVAVLQGKVDSDLQNE